MKSIFFGSIGAVAETSDIQRRAYNRALQEAGLAWHWDSETYRQLLGHIGGRDRLRLLADATGTDLPDATIETIHARKTQLACEEIAAGGARLRPGVALLARQVKAGGGRIGFVTSTERANIDAIFAMAGDDFSEADMDVVIGRADVAHGKPAPDAYLAALRVTRLEPGEVIAIEDTASSARSARRAGLQVLVTPGAFAGPIDQEDADLVLPSLVGDDGVIHGALAAFLASA